MPDDQTFPKEPTLFAEASLVSHSPKRESSKLKTTPDISGRKCLELSGNSGPLGCVEKMLLDSCATGAPHLRQRLWIIAHADSESEPDGAFDGNARQRQLGFGFVADPKSNFKDGLSRKPDKEPDRRHTRLEPKCGSNGQSGRRPGPTLADPKCTGLKQDHWSFEPEVGRLVNGLPNRVPQLRALGNSIIPQIAERIGYAIASTLKGE